MGQAVSVILPFAVGCAISPIPVIAVILMLFTARARVNAPLYAAGFALGLLIVSSIAYVVSDNQNTSTGDDGSDWAFAVKLLLGLLLFALALKQWRDRPKTGDPPKPPPKWMQAIDQLAPVRAFGIGVLLSALNPKNLLLAVAAGTSIAQLGVSTTNAWAGLIAFVILGSLSIVVPVVYFFVAGQSAEKHLNEAKGWLGANNATVMTVLFAFIGTSLVSQGLQGLLA